jgi:hypothetical protein
VLSFLPGIILTPVPRRLRVKMPPKLKNPAQWWWGPAVCELWAANHKDKRRAKFYTEAVDALDAVHVGGVLVVVKQKTNWGCAGEYTTD